ncbi:maleylpyruvate isomerase family mycothiol-dependent enzyme [Amycolatopsis sp. PS_44_ISF1]|uniref:maleylpyruvate isomerase family mycothiol-dependent enzyme n=1 Tax=Amycolatopsis sp. PS_44_ISF1 TaxID=2974917 RepID=UPI0028E019D8|nr:maleylpyruvate isomerase family mycothiol-dependent enzyme [Amycolatopsis sp. PS_44_ISF1]MDT8911986.1 maleylpyruvate isomerase family mycothiol-dependent enzyme [Amycolatopsis sp. PS_44_ISF1]
MEPIEEWTNGRHRVAELTAGISGDEAGRPVPACPDWTVRELLAHMIGLNADVLAGDEPDDHNQEWTQAQVDRRADRTVAGLLAEWRELAGPMRQWMRENNTRPLGDLLIHEQDLRGALGVSGGQEAAGLAALREDFAERFRAAVREQPPIRLDGDGWQWTSQGPAEAAAVVVEAGTFDLTRALMSRRSPGQLRSWTTRGDVGPYLAGFASLGDLPDRDLTE